MIAGYAPGELEATIASSRLEQRIVHHKLLEHGLQRLRLHQARSLKLFEGSSQPSHLLIVTGPPGAGKTTLLKRHKLDFPDVETIDGRLMPVVLVEMPFPCTRKGLVEAILMAMGHEPSADWKTTRIVDEIANFARRHGVLMIAIDEADRIFGSEAPLLAKFLVSLLNSLDCQLLLAGAPEIQQLHKGWGLERRKEVDLILDPYRFNTREGQIEFRSMLGLFEQNMGLPEPSDINSPDFSRRLYLASEGHVGLVSKLLVEALKRAHMRQSGKLSLALLGEVFAAFKRGEEDEEIEYDCDAETIDPADPFPSSDNPFLCTSGRLKILWDDLHEERARQARNKGNAVGKNTTIGAKGKGKSS